MKTLNMMTGGGMNTAQELAEMLRQMGRGRDTILAHITPEEAEMLLKMGGSGTINPKTGLPEFQTDYEYEAYFGNQGAGQSDVGADYNYDVEAQPGGFYGNTDAATYNPMTGETTYSSFLPSDATYETALAQAQAAERPDLSMRPSGQVFAAPTGSGLEQRLQQLEAFARRNPLATQLGVGLAQALMARQAAKPLSAQARQMRERADRTRAMALEAQQRAQAGGLTAAEQRRLQIAQARARQGLGERGMAQGSAAAGILASQEARVRGEAKEQSLDEYARLMGLVDQDLINAANLDLKRDQYLSDLAAKVLTGLVTTPRQAATPPRG